MRALVALASALVGAVSIPARAQTVRLITLDPGHFHASLVQKYMYDGVDSVVHVYAPAGDDVQEHLARIAAFNTRAAAPTHWHEELYTGPDYFERMLRDRAGTVVVIAGNNARKTEYIARSVDAGFNVLADKPMARVPEDITKLDAAFRSAHEHHVLLYDVMTERYEATNAIQRELSRNRALFGDAVKGTPDDPGIRMESVHYFSKLVNGAPLRRPAWFFDVRQEGEGIVDVTTHLVDLIQWELFPDQVLSPSDVAVLNARRWPTKVTRAQFASVTGRADFPPYLAAHVTGDTLNVQANAEFNYRLRGVNSRVTVKWDFQTPPGAGDTHYSLFRGTRARLVIRQGAAEMYKPVLYVERDASVPVADFTAALERAVASLQGQWRGVAAEADANGARIRIPAQFDIGHEAHFAQVTEHFLAYLRQGALPDWEEPGMRVKYHTIMQAYTMSHR